MAEIIARTSFASGLAPAAETFFCIPRRRVRTLRLRRARLVVWRARLEADRVLAMVKICEAGRVAESSRPVKARSALSITQTPKTMRCGRSAVAPADSFAPCDLVFPQ